MATVAAGDYIGKSFRPDCDLVGGELQERNVGELEHSRMQMAIILWFGRYIGQWGLHPLPEMRIQTGIDRFRVADIAVRKADLPDEPILITPPLIVIEILSPEDRITRYKERLDDYRAMGIPNIWVIDPVALEGFDCSTGNWTQTDTFRVDDSAVFVPLKELGIV